MPFITMTAGPTRVSAKWLDPRYGAVTPIHTYDNLGGQTLEPTTAECGSDWILVLGDAAGSYAVPGQASLPY